MTNYNSKAMCCLVHKKDRPNSLQLVIDNRRRVWYSCGKNDCNKWYNPPDDDKNKDRSDAFEDYRKMQGS
jgi:hypothetical protein